MELKSAVIVDAARSPFGRGGKGLLSHRDILDVAVEVVKALMARNPKVDPWLVEDVGVGNAAGLFTVGAKIIAREAGLPHEVGGYEVDRQCGSSMEVCHHLARAIMVGEVQCGLAVGVERMGTSLMGGFAGAMDQIKKSPGPKPDMGKLMGQNELQKKMQPNHFEIYSVPIPQYILESIPLQQMVQTAQNVVEMYEIPREELDQYAVESHRKTWAAIQAGRYAEEIIPIKSWEPVLDEQKKIKWDEKGKEVTVTYDDCVRPESTVEKLAKLPPVQGVVSFAKPPKPVQITAGNSCPTNDGASAVLWMEEKLARDLGLKPLARFKCGAVSGTKPQLMGIGPIPSSAKALKKAGLAGRDLDVIEINEAFACQVIASIKDLKLDPAKVCPNGGSIAIGHPLGASGARLVGTLARELHLRKARYGLATMCIGNGQGIATILEGI